MPLIIPPYCCKDCALLHLSFPTATLFLQNLDLILSAAKSVAYG